MSQQPYEPYEPYDPYQQPPGDAYQQPQQPQPGEHHQQPGEHHPYPQLQPYEPSYDAYAQQQQQQQWPQGGGHEVPQGHTQTFQGQTWDTEYHQQQVTPQSQPQSQPQVTGADTAYLPPQGYVAEPLPAETAAVGGTVPPAAQAPAAQAPAAQEAAVPSPDYGPPTVTGNTRVTDAQRARAEGRSPVIEPGMQPAAITAALGLLLAGGAAIGTYALLVPLLALQALTAAGWFRLNGMWPARQGIALAFLGGVVADAVVLVAGRENAPAAILGTGGVWVLLTLVLQLRSHAGADERMYGLMATVTSAALAVLGAGTLAAEPAAVSVGAAAVAAAVIARALPLPGPASVVVALLAAAGAGIAVGGMTALGAGGALLGLGAGVCALVGLRVASYDYPSRFVHMTAGVALPLTAAVPALYLLGRAIA
ncbi:hypothetical protein ACFQVC_34950 [Streptomyces monticola]|uniref:Membrane protein YfcA n=1 Tax=Streptomyces monticola TaxID=2666263 RepID=A0ABW2JUQ6_9ACTN